MCKNCENLKAQLAAASSERDSLAEQLRVARETCARCALAVSHSLPCPAIQPSAPAPDGHWYNGTWCPGPAPAHSKPSAPDWPAEPSTRNVVEDAIDKSKQPGSYEELSQPSAPEKCEKCRGRKRIVGGTWNDGQQYTVPCPECGGKPAGGGKGGK